MVFNWTPALADEDMKSLDHYALLFAADATDFPYKEIKLDEMGNRKASHPARLLAHAVLVPDATESDCLTIPLKPVC